MPAHSKRSESPSLLANRSFVFRSNLVAAGSATRCWRSRRRHSAGRLPHLRAALATGWGHNISPHIPRLYSARSVRIKLNFAFLLEIFDNCSVVRAIVVLMASSQNYGCPQKKRRTDK